MKIFLFKHKTDLFRFVWSLNKHIFKMVKHKEQTVISIIMYFIEQIKVYFIKLVHQVFLVDFNVKLIRK